MIICLSGFVIGGLPPGVLLGPQAARAPGPAAQRYSAPQPVTHAVIKTYYDGPLAVGAHPGSPGRQPPAYLPPPAPRPLQAGSSSDSLSSASSAGAASHAGHAGHSGPAPAPLHCSPVKSRRVVNHSMGLHYPAGYRAPPQHNVAIGPAAAIGQSPRAVSPAPAPRRVRTLYACVGENDGELSFEPNQIITNVKSSPEPGWLEGTLNGKSGLVPENYVAALP